MSGLVPPLEPRWARSNWQSYCVGLPEDVDQIAVMQSMLDAGISAKRGIMCAHRHEAYAKEPWRSVGGLTASERAEDRSILIPLFSDMTEDDQDRVVDALRLALATGRLS
jgi:dTDP-4-amino-4,6-dideoxygalactose transaminase